MTEEQVIQLFKCLSDRSRLQILKNLAIEPMYVELLAERLELTPSTVSFHLKKLMDAGLVSSTKEQYYVVYEINKDQLLLPIIELIKAEPTDVDNQSQREELYREKILKSFFTMGKLRNIPVQKKKRRIILEEIAKDFEIGKEYAEKEVNIIIAEYHDDFCTIRREMVDERILERNNGIYKLV